MNKIILKSIIRELGLSQVGFARSIGIGPDLLRRMLMDDHHRSSRGVSPNVEAEAMSMLAHHRGHLPEWTIGIDAENEMETTTIHHNIYPRFTAFISDGVQSGVSVDAGGDDSISIIWHSIIATMGHDQITDWSNRALAAEQNYNIGLEDD